MPPESFESGQNPSPSCKHARTRLIAADKDAQFLECLDCGAILEVEEPEASASFGESLSDA